MKRVGALKALTILAAAIASALTMAASALAAPITLQQSHPATTQQSVDGGATWFTPVAPLGGAGNPAFARIAGTDWLAQTVNGSGQGVNPAASLYRTTFNLPAVSISSVQVQVHGDNWVSAVSVNGNPSIGSQTPECVLANFQGAPDVFTIPSSQLVTTGNTLRFTLINCENPGTGGIDFDVIAIAPPPTTCAALPAPTPGSFGAEVIADNPGWWWCLGEPSGTSMTTRVGGATGYYQNGVQLNQSGIVGDTGTSALFDGRAAHAYVNGVTAPTQAYTMEIWMMPSAPAQAGTLMDHGGGGALYMQTNGICFNQTRTPACGTSVPSTTAWTHVVGSWDAVSKRARLYVNGALEADVAAPNAPSGTGTLFIGYGQWAPWFKGLLDEAVYYPTALSAIRVAAHYHAGCAC